MPKSIQNSDIKTIVEEFLKDGYILGDISRFVDVFNLPRSDTQQNLSLFRMGTLSSYTLLYYVLETWKGRNFENDATFEALIKILSQNEYIAVSDQLKRKFLLNEAVGVESSILAPVVVSTSGSQPQQSQPQQSNVNRDLERYGRANKWAQYTVLEFLGAGSFGLVFKIQRNVNMLPTAAKIIVADLFDSGNDATSDEVALANRELQTMKKLPPHKNLVELLSSDVLHPNPNLTSILKVYGDAVNLEYIENAKYMAEYLSFVSQSKFRPTIIIEMELCGPTLRQWLVLDDTYKKFKNGMTEEFALFQFKIAQCIIAGLTHLHDNSHIHRDLKPENIYFSVNNFQTPIVKIGDLGFTREMSGNSTETRTEAKGTRIYRAPEVNSGKYGKQADLFALGLILWEIFEIVPFKKFSQLEARLEKLTIDREKLNIGNAWVPNLDEIIFNLTFRDKTKRTKKIGDFDLKFVSKVSDDDSDVDMSLIEFEFDSPDLC